MPRTLWLNRDRYGVVTEATFDPPPPKLLKDERFDEWTGEKRERPVRRFEKKRQIGSYKDLVWAFCQGPGRYELFNAAWRMALKFDFTPVRPKLSELDEYIDTARTDAEVIENFIGELVNDPDSRFHIYG